MFFKTILVLMMNIVSMDKINDIKDLKWSNRVLVIRAEGKIDLSDKVSPFKEKFEERDFIVVYVRKQKTFIKNKIMSKTFSKSLFQKIKNINSNQYFILIGKDGQVKKSYPSSIEVEKILYDVDEMPMRKYEMIIRKK